MILKFSTSIFLFFLVDKILCQNEFDSDEDVVFLVMDKTHEDYGKAAKVTNSNFGKLKESEIIVKDKMVTFLVHGFTEGTDAKHHQRLVKALLEAEDQILIFVDWSKGAKLLSYMKARENVEIAAESTSKFIEKLHNEHQVNYDSITLIGFSLGAHVVGLAGQKLENVKLPRIIGIDPAGPLFSLEEFQRRINNESAKYVECIHAGSWMNLQEHICTNDIFINGGKGQPGCFNFFRVEDAVCSHIRAVDIWTEVVKNPNKFKAVMCDDLSGALRKMCKNDETLILNDVKNSELNTEERTGIYLIETTGKAPFYIEN